MVYLVAELKATHNRAGEITYEQIGPLTIRAIVTTYTKTSSVGADRDSLEVSWGDGTKQFIVRSNDKGIPLENDVKRNFYIAEHTYPGRSSYTISFEDPNRSGNILNINYPRSDDVKFFLATRFTLLDQQFQGKNSSAVLLQAPIDVACVGKRFIHNPNAYDVDGDSLSYELIIPFESNGQEVPRYVFPDRLLPGPANQISLNPVTGDFVWEFPPQSGEFNIAMRINEWRGGVLLNSIIRDMQILVVTCSNAPPIIESIENLCVVAGEEIIIPLTIFDSDLKQKVRLEVTGSPLLLKNNSPTILNLDTLLPSPAKAELRWKTDCSLIRKDYYQLVFRAVDNSINDSTGLSTLKTIRIKIVGPPPNSISATPFSEKTIRVRWTNPYRCELGNNDKFIGFSVWRKEGNANLVIDTCSYDGIRSNYTRIIFNTLNKDQISYFIDDENVKDNITYCYRILAEFANKSEANIAINKVVSLPSNDVCTQLKRDIPLFTKVSVINTSTSNGIIEVEWTKPILRDFDTLKFKGPYKTELLRSTNNNFTIIANATKISNSFGTWKDTIFSDIGINTNDTNVVYKLKFYYEGNKEFKNVPTASSVFLKIDPMDKQNRIAITYETPWDNRFFYIYRGIDNQNFVLIDSTSSRIYEDENLSNSINYCYRVLTKGTYSILDIKDPLFNFSQERCQRPSDINAPCIPSIEVFTICDENLDQPINNPENSISVKFSNNCKSEEIPSGFNIYFKKTINSEFNLIGSTDFKTKKLTHSPGDNTIAGCYVATSIDSLKNESRYSKEVCVENCAIYQLPNTFTPNGDGSNDVFKPMKNFFIKSVDFRLYNEWGSLIYKTDTPSLDWTGKTQNGNEHPTGTYYYTCQVFKDSANGLILEKDLKGYINLLR
jgi:gliding motility-associated-like protein